MTRGHPAAGQEIDGFRLEALLNVGGMATLWRATREDSPLPLAMKIPLQRDGDDPTPIVGFEVEQMILPRLVGPHVPRFKAAGGFARQPYIAMELITGASLKSRLEALPLPAPEVAALGAKVATALHDLHRQHVLHLDVKPSNVMLRESGEAVLVDFGLSRHDELPDLLAEEFRLPFGTSPYIAPEQVMGVRNEPRSDLFALGVMLYYFATGERPFGVPHGRRGCAAGCGATRSRPARSGPTCRPGSRNASCAAWRSTPRRGSAARPSSPSPSPTPIRCF